MEKVRIAFIGCGGRSWVHISRLMTFDDVELCGFMDVLPERAQEKCEKAGQGKVYLDAAAMLDEVKPDIVYICVPPDQHGKIEDAVIERGIHFFVEKPMALTMEMAQDICDRAKAKGLIACCGFQDRYLELVEQCRIWMQGRQVGHVDAAWVGGIPGVPWWPKYETSGGQIVEQNIHLFDMLRYLFGEADTVYCAGSKGLVQKEGYNLHDASTAVITMKSGLIATIFTGCYRTGGKPNGQPDFPKGMTIHCADGDIRYYLRNRVTLDTPDEVITKKWTRDWQTDMNRTIIDAVKTGDASKIRSPYEDALKSLRLTFACNESLKTGLPVKL